ncbi:hypothetical protein PG988_009256 [Apiospora saccharicola]
MAEANTSLGWFDLPPEIRNKIYLELLSRPQTEADGFYHFPIGSFEVDWPEVDLTEQTSREEDSSDEDLPEEKEPLSVAILRTSKRVYNEAVGYLYSENTLYLSGPLYLAEAILPTFGTDKLRFLRYASFAWPEWEEYYYSDSDSDPDGLSSDSFGAVGLLVQHCPDLREIEFEDAGLRGAYLPGGVDQLLDAFHLFNSYLHYLQAVSPLEKISVRVNPSDRWRRQFDDLWDDEHRVYNAMSDAGWVLVGRDYYRW